MNVVGAPPNLMRIASLVWEMERDAAIRHTLLHTGQHYDDKMSQVFFDELGIPKPDIYLGVGAGVHGEQTARVIIAFELCHNARASLIVQETAGAQACHPLARRPARPGSATRARGRAERSEGSRLLP